MQQLNESFSLCQKKVIFKPMMKFYLGYASVQISVLMDGLIRIQFDIQNIYAYTDSLSSNTSSPFLINPWDLRLSLDEIKDQFEHILYSNMEIPYTEI